MVEQDDMPGAVYWRRRAIGIAAGLVVFAMLIWLLGTMLEDVDTTPANAANRQALAAAASSSNPRSNPPSTGPVASPSSSSTAPPSPTADPGLTPAAQPEGPPQPCPDTVIKLTAETAQPSYKIGQRPSFTLGVTNTGPVACVRDISRQLRELFVTTPDRSQRIWSSNDCNPAGSDETPVLQPGEKLLFSLLWGGRTSAPGCPAKRAALQPGQYALIAKLGALASDPTPFTLTN